MDADEINSNVEDARIALCILPAHVVDSTFLGPKPGRINENF
jgi:hypothetical protein